MKIQAMVTTPEKDFQKQTLNLAEPKADEVLVRLVASGIVEKIGEYVTTVKPGDHVVLGFSYCGTCDNCLEGNAGGCENMIPLNFGGKNEHGVSPLSTEENEEVSQFFGQSSFATYSTVDEKNIVKVDREVDLRYLGPFGCGFMTGSGTVLNAIQPEPGNSFVVFRTGAVGISGMLSAKVAGCYPIIAVDIHDSRLELAKQLGATHTIKSKNEDPVAKIKEITGKGAHYSLETTGVPEVTLSGLRCLRVKGVCATVAVGKRDLLFNVFNEVVANPLTLRGVIEGDAIPQLTIPKLVSFFKNGQFPVDKLVKFYDIEDIDQASVDLQSNRF